jgi:hypothetical protein
MNTPPPVRLLFQQCQQSLVASNSLIPRRSSSAYTLRPTVRGPLSNQGGLSQHRKISNMAQKQEAHQYQSGNSTDRDIDQWKHREPYRVHKKAENFEVKWEGQCHCGKVQYQLSRDKPLAAKYCHCTTCQRLHGVSDIFPIMISNHAS